MIVDASALIAILRAEPEALAFAKAIAAAKTRRLSAASYVEAAAVIDSAGDAVASSRLDELLDEAGVVIEPVTAEQARSARAACRDFGKGRGHWARLISAIVFPVRWRRPFASRCSIRATILRTRMCEAPCEATRRKTASRLSSRGRFVRRSAPALRVSRSALAAVAELVDALA